MADNSVVLIIMIKEGPEVHKKETAADFHTVGVIVNRTFKVIMKQARRGSYLFTYYLSYIFAQIPNSFQVLMLSTCSLKSASAKKLNKEISTVNLKLFS